MNHPLILRRLAAVALAGAAVFAGAPAAADDKPGAGPLKVDPLVGYWVGVVTIVNCAAGTPLFHFDTGQLVNHGGTINTTDYTNPPTSNGPGMGYWHRQKNGTYFVRFRFVQYTPDGHVSGFRVVSKTVTLKDADHQSSEIRSEVQDPSGHPVTTVCAVETATRFR